MISIRVIQVFLVSAVLSLVLLSWGSNISTNNSTIVENLTILIFQILPKE